MAPTGAIDFDVPAALFDLVTALGLGLLVGLQRERVLSPLAGVRTFPLITVLGTLTALLAQQTNWWVLGAGLAGLAVVTAVASNARLRAANGDVGITTEVAIILMYAVGAFVVVGSRQVAVTIGAGVAILLHAKPILHATVARLGEKDVRAIMQFALISMVILPALPDATYGPSPFNVLNPRHIWLIVVLVVAVSLGGYVAFKLFSDRAGAALAGLLGGLVSSTATTASYARQAATTPGMARLAGAIIMIATTVMYIRIMVMITAAAPNFAPVALPRISALLGLSLLLSALAWMLRRGEKPAVADHQNPTELRAALFFGGLYAIILLGVATGQKYFGDSGIYVVSALSGVADMDAITISTSRMVEDARLQAPPAVRAIVIASMSNLVFKGAMAGILGGRRMLASIGPLFGALFVGSAALLWLW